jgi:plastocyanin domain-containing protein
MMLAAAFAGTGDGNAADADDIRIVDGKQVVTSTLSSGKYPNITVQAGTPVKWVITAPEGSVNGCNYQVIIPEYGLRYDFKTGENILEFTPTDAGKYTYSCWMGMIRGTITVTQASASEATGSPEQSVGSGGYDESQVAFATIQNGIQYVTSSAALNGYEPIRVRLGLPVKWTLNMSEEALTACNNAIYIPEYDMEIALHQGDNLIEFTPEKSGRYLFSCWMGMTYGSITVERADGTVDNTQDDGASKLPSCCG